MNHRTRTLWLPSLLSLTASMVWMLILQRALPQPEMRLNHAGLPLLYQLLWLATLPLFGAASAFLSRRAGGDRTVALSAALSPSILMIPLWLALATRMNHPSPRQWFNLLCGVLNWIVTPGAALFIGALPFLKTRPVRDSKESRNIRTMNTRTATFWLPALVSLTAAMVFLTISTVSGLQPRFVARGWATFVVYIPWLLTLPLCGAAGAFLSRRAGGGRWVCLAAGLFPVMAMTCLVGLLALIGRFVFAKPQWLHFSMALILGAVLPSVALLLGAVPFAKASGRT